MPDVDLSNRKLWTEKYLPSVVSPNIYNILFGSAGSGKSQTMIQFFLSEILNHKQNQNQTYFVIRKVAGTIRNSVFADFKNKINDWNMASLVVVRNSYLEIHAGNNRIVFLGCDDPEKLKSLSQAKYIWIEEATELTLEDFTQITLRLRGKSQFKKRFFLTFNPVSDAHWIKKRFFDDPPEHERDLILQIHATFKDNLDKLDEEYSVRMEALREVNETLYQIYALGNWGIWDRENLFAMDFDEEIHVVDGGWNAHKRLPLYLSFDFNTGNNTCLVGQHIKNHSGHKYWADINILRIYIGADLENICKTVMVDYPGFEIYINGDSSGHSGNALTSDNISAYQLITNYFRINPELQLQVPAGNLRHSSSQLHVNTVFKKCRIRIFRNQHLKDKRDGNLELIADLKSAKMYKNSLEKWKKDNPTLGHRLDAFRYYISANFYEIVSDFNIASFNKKIENMAQ